jgi:pyruvate dehydrogenase (quinone)
MELVMPPKLELASVAGMALYSVKAVLEGRTHGVIALVENNIVK